MSLTSGRKSRDGERHSETLSVVWRDLESGRLTFYPRNEGWSVPFRCLQSETSTLVRRIILSSESVFDTVMDIRRSQTRSVYPSVLGLAYFTLDGISVMDVDVHW